MARLGNLPTALSMAGEAVDELTGLVRENPTDTGWRQDLAFLHVTFARLLAASMAVSKSRIGLFSAVIFLRSIRTAFKTRIANQRRMGPAIQ
jgi:hypothetical protein